jgi:putative aminopeptidase FrvX
MTSKTTQSSVRSSSRSPQDITDLAIDVDGMVDFLVELLNTPSPTGDTLGAIKFIQGTFANLPFSTSISRKGLLAGTWQGERNDAPRALTAHTDTLGAMVSAIKENGRLQMTQLGGWIWSTVEGEGVTIFASNGSAYRGTILPTFASIHAHTREEGNATRTAENMEVRIDARTTSEAETAALGICVGDIIAFDPRVELSPDGFIRSRHLDDKAGVAVIYGALLALASAGLRPAQTTTIHISNYEEVGHGGATGFPANLAELVTVDMAVVAPDQTSDEFSVTICAKDSGGPYHMGLRRRLESLASGQGIRYRTDIYPHYGSDGEAFWRAGGDIAVALIGPGIDASHHYERTHREALAETTRLLAAYLLDTA